MTHRVFIDGEAGTTGLQIRARLEERRDLTLVHLPERLRRDVEARREALNSADAVILCLPDDAAREAVALIEDGRVRVIDASSAHRTAPGWTYGFPELRKGQRGRVAASLRVSNPGCYPTGFLALVRPLIDAGVLPAGYPLSVNAISGYTGGGKAMIAEFEGEGASAAPPFRPYALGLGHKHLAEMRQHAGLDHPPIFTPAVGRYAQGMIVEVPLALHALPGAPTLDAVRDVLRHAYAGEGFVQVVDDAELSSTTTLDPEALNRTNRLKLYAFGNEAAGQARLVALLDNLGKGAAGAAVQNLNLTLHVDEGEGL